jgi:hypothetical protein
VVDILELVAAPVNSVDGAVAVLKDEVEQP